MKEDLIRKIFQRYLHKLGKNIKRRSKSTAGPDFIVEGSAYECKGSKFNEKRLFSQLLSYGLQYSQINLVLPYNALNFKFLWKLEAVEKFLRVHPNREKSIKIYLIAHIKEKTYTIAYWSCARMLNSEISSIFYRLIPKFVNIPIEEKEEKIITFLNNIENQIKEEFKKQVLEKAQTAKNIWKGSLIHLKS